MSEMGQNAKPLPTVACQLSPLRTLVGKGGSLVKLAHIAWTGCSGLRLLRPAVRGLDVAQSG
jgi:hypothetical protein